LRVVGSSLQKIWGVARALGEFLQVVRSSLQKIWGVVRSLGEFLGKRKSGKREIDGGSGRSRAGESGKKQEHLPSRDGPIEREKV
jgi:hypothetical protein